jgi:hypothetical protein
MPPGEVAMKEWVVAGLLTLAPPDLGTMPDQLLVRRAAEAVRTAYHCPEYRTAALLKEALRDRNIEIANPDNFAAWQQAVELVEDLFESAGSDEKPQLCETFWTLYGEGGSAERGWLEMRPR